LPFYLAQSHAGGWFATDGAASKKTKRRLAQPKAGHSLTAARAVAQQNSNKPKTGGTKGSASKQQTAHSGAKSQTAGARADGKSHADHHGHDGDDNDDDGLLHASPEDAALAHFTAHGFFDLRPSRPSGVRHAESARAVTHVRALAVSVVALSEALPPPQLEAMRAEASATARYRSERFDEVTKVVCVCSLDVVCAVCVWVWCESVCQIIFAQSIHCTVFNSFPFIDSLVFSCKFVLDHFIFAGCWFAAHARRRRAIASRFHVWQSARR
jgi:hypothetical protein